ncbi:hypothetical protein MLD38_006417 [Melastoma candidum]|uniref:Uncharacterized protein n=1 Tax=Melastoma candidum TaxID=119954 RepID=A0ACB9RP33_9MYRT|nr:hypothetical protein MLD38_006417 [Melastoma candidum]
MGLPDTNHQGGLPLYQPSGNLGSWETSPAPNAAGTGLAMATMHGPDCYPSPNGLCLISLTNPYSVQHLAHRCLLCSSRSQCNILLGPQICQVYILKTVTLQPRSRNTSIFRKDIQPRCPTSPSSQSFRFNDDDRIATYPQNQQRPCLCSSLPTPTQAVALQPGQVATSCSPAIGNPFIPFHVGSDDNHVGGSLVLLTASTLPWPASPSAEAEQDPPNEDNPNILRFGRDRPLFLPALLRQRGGEPSSPSASELIQQPATSEQSTSLTSRGGEPLNQQQPDVPGPSIDGIQALLTMASSDPAVDPVLFPSNRPASPRPTSAPRSTSAGPQTSLKSAVENPPSPGVPKAGSGELTLPGVPRPGATPCAPHRHDSSVRHRYLRLQALQRDGVPRRASPTFGKW